MFVSSRAALVLLWQIRIVFRVLVWLAMSVGTTMVALANAFRACGRASQAYGPLVIPAQIVLLFAWAPARMLFLGLERSARFAHRTHAGLQRRRLAVA